MNCTVSHWSFKVDMPGVVLAEGLIRRFGVFSVL